MRNVLLTSNEDANRAFAEPAISKNTTLNKCAKYEWSKKTNRIEINYRSLSCRVIRETR